MTAIEKDSRVHDLGNIKLALDDIRRTAEYASDIAEVAMNVALDEVTEKHSPTAENNINCGGRWYRSVTLRDGGDP